MENYLGGRCYGGYEAYVERNARFCGRRVQLGIPSGEDNTHEFRKEELDRMWDVIKQRKEWEFKEKELENQAKKMWLDALLGNGAVTNVLDKIIPKLPGMG